MKWGKRSKWVSYEMKQRSLVNTGDISSEIVQVNTDNKVENNSDRYGFLSLKKREAERSETGEFNLGEGVTW